jgi:hypothetical protein
MRFVVVCATCGPLRFAPAIYGRAAVSARMHKEKTGHEAHEREAHAGVQYLDLGRRYDGPAAQCGADAARAGGDRAWRGGSVIRAWRLPALVLVAVLLAVLAG